MNQVNAALAANTWPAPPVVSTLFSWGYNANGRLGDGTTTNRSSPVQIGALTNWGTNLGRGFDQNSAVSTHCQSLAKSFLAL